MPSSVVSFMPTPSVLGQRRVDLVAAEQRAQRVRADADQVLTGRLALVHRVERRDRRDLGLGEVEHLGAERDAVGADVALLGLHQVQHRQQRRAALAFGVAAHQFDRGRPARRRRRPTGRPAGRAAARSCAGCRAPPELAGHRSHPPITGSIEATEAMTSAIRPPTDSAAVDCRLMKDGSRKCTRYGPGAAVADDVRAELAARRLDRGVDLPGRHPEALGDQLEVVDQRLHRGVHDLLDVLERVAHAVRAERELRRPGDLRVVDHHRAGLEPVEHLLDDLERLAHLGDLDHEPRPAVAAVIGRHLEVERLVAQVRARSCAGPRAGRRRAGSAR